MIEEKDTAVTSKELPAIDTKTEPDEQPDVEQEAGPIILHRPRSDSEAKDRIDDDDKKYLSISEAATLAGKHRTTISRWIYLDKILPVFRTQTNLPKVRKSDVLKLSKNQGLGPRPRPAG